MQRRSGNITGTPLYLIMNYQAGDFILVHGTGFFDKLIQFGQGLRFQKQDAYWNHVALIISPDGDLIEAVAAGVKQTHISKYIQKKIAYKIVPIEASADDRLEAVRFANSCLSQGYDWWNIISLAFCLLFGLKFAFGYSGEDVCSGLVARSLERTTAIFPRDTRNMTPADLAKQYITALPPEQG